ncbi:Aste57867_9738 [Aphanomyces stellatus]|uniref:Aste57867_9738 protein n=1 Tax=Aphanomyces stellatus TaxID=120398 RepID=A0A485KNN0_9STRA|nr:hypothetical protein As57867_009700 [Aphanomyces stellatus]VFT86617.1 Aste57867_9738 [Aphanomyces stellatus]
MPFVRFRSAGFVAFAYMFGNSISSFLFLSVSQNTLANDFLWERFNGITTQPFLCNVFNLNLQVSNPTRDFRFNDTTHGRYATTTKTPDATIHSTHLYPNIVQDEINANLNNVVQALRAMDSCSLPWIATAYCFLDFDQIWSMAYSARRQKRCTLQVQNGAIYFETALRNANWPHLMACWGHSLSTAIFLPLLTSNSGQIWLDTVQNNHISVASEVAYWQSYNVISYRTQWQNYKRLGATEFLSIENAIGFTYPLTLKRSNSTFQISAGTSFIMYWSLANDLTQVVNNASELAGCSLLGGSLSFPYVNLSSGLQVPLMEQHFLPNPLGPVLTTFSNTIGPFGVVDLRRVATPPELQTLYRSIQRFLVAKLATGGIDIQKQYWSIYTQYFLTPQPQAWDLMNMWGGDLNCGSNYGGSWSRPLQYFSSAGNCGNYLTDYISTPTQNIIVALVAANLIDVSVTKWTLVSTRDPDHATAILNMFNKTTPFLQNFGHAELGRFKHMTDAARLVVRDVMALSFVQYIQPLDSTDYTLSRVNVFAPSEPDLEFFSWLYLFDWIEGKREVVTFEGDVDSVTTISAPVDLDTRPVNGQEIPLNMSSYILRVVQYITIVLFGVGCIVCIYILTSQGYVEGLHMIPFNLIAGHVWVGRPLMLLRGLTAVCFLSTSTLELVTPHTGLISYFESPAPNIFSIFLSSTQISWLVYVVVDTFSIFTSQYTANYSTLSAIIVTMVVFVWSVAVPPTHSASIARSCTIVAVDFDVVCTSGIVRIGDVTRFTQLIIVCACCTLLCFLVEHCRHRMPPPKLKLVSFLIYSAAKHEFEQNIHLHWEHNGVYYIDKASATLSGLLTLEYDNARYIFDIKTWRVYALSTQEMSALDFPLRLRHAIPLVE